MGFAIEVIFIFEYTMQHLYLNAHKGIQHIVQHPHFKFFTHKGLIYTINFRFGAHKVETTYIPSNRVHDLSMERNSAMTQIASSHVDSYEEMNEGNYSIHVGTPI